MCSTSCLYFAFEQLSEHDVQGKTVLEVGARDVNGSVRRLVERLKPRKYIGVDAQDGKGVDLLCPAERLVGQFGANSFDLVVSTEMVEHVLDWRTAISNIKQVTKPTGIILITTRAFGFPYHGYPNDYWRYEVSDMKVIFSYCEILALESDPSAPGTFIKARKPEGFQEADLSRHELCRVSKLSRLTFLLRLLSHPIDILMGDIRQ